MSVLLSQMCLSWTCIEKCFCAYCHNQPCTLCHVSLSVCVFCGGVWEHLLSDSLSKCDELPVKVERSPKLASGSKVTAALSPVSAPSSITGRRAKRRPTFTNNLARYEYPCKQASVNSFFFSTVACVTSDPFKVRLLFCFPFPSGILLIHFIIFPASLSHVPCLSIFLILSSQLCEFWGPTTNHHFPNNTNFSLAHLTYVTLSESHPLFSPPPLQYSSTHALLFSSLTPTATPSPSHKEQTDSQIYRKRKRNPYLFLLQL